MNLWKNKHRRQQSYKMRNLIEKLPIGTDIEILYRESQGKKGDREIIERYKGMIDYFIRNPDRAAAEINQRLIGEMVYNDVILQEHRSLCHMILSRILNLPSKSISEKKNWSVQ